MRRRSLPVLMALLLASASWTDALAQQATQVLRRGMKQQMANDLTDTGGSFYIEQMTADLTVNPASQAFTSVASLQIMGERGSVKKLQLMLHNSRRVIKVTSNGAPLQFSHVGSFLIVYIANNPIPAGSRRTFQLTYTGKMHSVSRQLVRDYRIEKYNLKYTAMPFSGNLEGTATIDLMAVKDPFFTKEFEENLKKMDALQKISPDEKPKLILGLNNEFTVNEIRLDNRAAEFYHSLGGIHIALDNAMKADERHKIQVAFYGKITTVDKNLIWDAFEPLYRIHRYYPAQPMMNMGSY